VVSIRPYHKPATAALLRSLQKKKRIRNPTTKGRQTHVAAESQFTIDAPENSQDAHKANLAPDPRTWHGTLRQLSSSSNAIMGDSR
jgi:hypothetical protein